MTREEAFALLRTVVHDVAPEADLSTVGPDEPIQEALDLDSIDFLNVVVAVHDRTGIDIPERDYAEMATVGGAVSYLAANVPSVSPASSG